MQLQQQQDCAESSKMLFCYAIKNTLGNENPLNFYI
jgi:hypothetical protein